MNKLLVLLGPTGVGKTELSLSLAEKYATSILSVDSRQMYKGLLIGTAAPTQDQLQKIQHYFIQNLDINQYYSASSFEQDALNILSQLFVQNPIVLACGGSMMYLDALCNGIDQIPSIDEELRQSVMNQYQNQGLEYISAQLKILDPDFYNEVDLKNPKRVIHALEVCLMTGKPYSSFRTKTKKERPFEIVKVGLMRDRDELYNRINCRVDAMMASGLLDEVKAYYSYKELNSLNTVGYKELIAYLDGCWNLDFAIEKIKQNSRIYSRKQMTWFKKDETIQWINLSESRSVEDILSKIDRLVLNK